MGYDLYVCDPAPEVQDSIDRARLEFDEAINLRNSCERGSDAYNKAQERISELFEQLNPIEAYFRFNIWGMATARRLMQEAGVPSETIDLFGSNDGKTVTEDMCADIAQRLRGSYDTTDPVIGFLNIVQALAKGDMPSSFELQVTSALIGMVDAATSGEGSAQLVTPTLLGHIPTVEELERRALDGELDAETAESLSEARMWLDYILDFATFNEKAIDGGGYRVC